MGKPWEELESKAPGEVGLDKDPEGSAGGEAEQTQPATGLAAAAHMWVTLPPRTRAAGKVTGLPEVWRGLALRGRAVG